MPLKILVNSAWESATQVIATDTSNATTNEDSTIENVTGGVPYLLWQSGATSDRRITYIDKSSRLTSTHFVLTRADRHVGHQIKLYKFASYPSSATLITSTANPLATSSLVGQSGQDLVIECAATNVEGLCAEFLAGTGGNYTKKVHQMYFANALTLNKPSYLTTSLANFPTYYKYRNKNSLINKRINIISEELTRDEVDSFEQLFRLKGQPFFIYDSDGAHIRYNLIHCMLENYQISPFQDNYYNISLNVVELRRWS